MKPMPNLCDATTTNAHPMRQREYIRFHGCLINVSRQFKFGLKDSIAFFQRRNMRRDIVAFPLPYHFRPKRFAVFKVFEFSDAVFLSIALGVHTLEAEPTLFETWIGGWLIFLPILRFQIIRHNWWRWRRDCKVKSTTLYKGRLFPPKPLHWFSLKLIKSSLIKHLCLTYTSEFKQIETTQL